MAKCLLTQLDVPGMEAQEMPSQLQAMEAMRQVEEEEEEKAQRANIDAEKSPRRSSLTESLNTAANSIKDRKPGSHNLINRESMRIEVSVDGDVAKHQDSEGNSQSGVRGNQTTSKGHGAGGRIDGQEQQSCPVSGELGGSTKPRTAGTMLEKGNLFETNGWSIETQRRRRLPAEVWKQIESRWRSLEKGEIQGAVEKELTKDDVKMSDGSVDGLGGSLSS